ncbi:hypothetical protein COCOR_05904 [Corallococcus coralloides DSM 2259]|uniref:Uncharacterized protein n=1 Tax=Corallococcus coralloides (strain ATCC 25202 / DSM 2259 / NBRC 100086 / M2) TaxID=1144275 RepID=H8MIB6_CORCM|nr:hypothetical protein [Corallococcus coralloides]AFE06646.1 hypothetical protein COCOR_05904 [Corallococcus coralloides DSM 2259]
MHIESSRSARSPKAATFLRIPVLLAVGMMTMGSGMGNPGCGSSSPPDCEEGCAIEGTYTLQFADSSPPGEGCEALGFGLPQGPLVLTLSDSYVTAKFGDETLSAYYEGEPARRLYFSTAQYLTEKKVRRTVRIDSTVAAPSPRSATDRSVIEGTYDLEILASEDNSVKCHIKRNFTATR